MSNISKSLISIVGLDIFHVNVFVAIAWPSSILHGMSTIASTLLQSCQASSGSYIVT